MRLFRPLLPLLLPLLLLLLLLLLVLVLLLLLGRAALHWTDPHSQVSDTIRSGTPNHSPLPPPTTPHLPPPGLNPPHPIEMHV